MPTFTVEDERSGRKFQLEGDSEPDEQELEEIFASQEQEAAEPPDLLSDMGMSRAPMLPIGQSPLPQMSPVSGGSFTPPEDDGFNFQSAAPPEESIPKLIAGIGSDVIGKPLELAGKAVVSGLNFPTTAQNFIEQDLLGSDRSPLKPIYEFGKPLLDLKPEFTPEELESMTPWQQRISGGVAKAGEAVSALTTPENIALLPAFGSAKVAKPLAGYLLGLVGLQEPAAIEKAIELAQDPNATPFQAAEAFTEAAVVNPVFAALLGKQVKGKPAGKEAAIKALVEELKKEPALTPKTPEAHRQLGITTPEGPISTPTSRPNPFFDRVSESEGLGRASTPPTVESIRAQRAAEAPKAEPLLERQPGETPPQELMSLSDAEARKFFEGNQKRGNATQNDAVLAGMKLGPEAVAEMTAMRDAAQVKVLDAIMRQDNTASFANQGRVVWLNGAIEGANKKGPNFDAVTKRLAKESTPAAKPLTGQEIGEILGAEFRGEAGKGGTLLQFEAKKPDGTPSTSFSVKKGATREEVLAKYREVMDRYKDDPQNAPRGLPEVAAEAALASQKPTSLDSPVITARQSGDTIFVQFDKRGGKAPTAAELTRRFQDAGHNVQFQEFAQDIGSAAGDRIKFKGVANDISGRASPVAAESAYRSVFGQSDPIAAKTQAEGKISAKERLSTALSPKEPTLESTPLDPQSGRSISETQGFLDRANIWADEVLNRDPRTQTRSGIDPAQEAARLAAITVKGAVLIRDGVTNFKEWSNRMVEQYGEGIRSQLNDLWEKANNYAKSTSQEGPRAASRTGDAVALPAGPVNPTASAEPPAISGGPERMRQSAARATTSESVPPPVQERIATAPESFYESQRYKTVEDQVAAMPDAELAAVPKESNFHVASRLELSRRLFAQGKHAEGYEVFKEVSRQGTEWGQNINQFKMLKGTTPANIVSLVNEGLKEAGRDPLNKKQMEDLAGTADKSIEANRKLKAEKDAWKKDPTDANAKKAQDALDAANKADLETQRHMNRYKIKTWPQMLKTFAQGNPLTPISHVANFMGNTVGAAMEGSSRGVANLVDATRAMFTGGERKIQSQPIEGAKASAIGFGRGLKEAPGILAKGSGDIVKGEARAGLQPLRSLVKAFAKNPDVPTVGGKVPMNERIRMAVEGTFGIAPETMLRLLSAADRPAYEAARSRLIAEQAKLKKIPRKDWDMARKFPELFFDRETIKQIKAESADAIFQRPSKAVDKLQTWIKESGGDWGDLAFTIMVSPYKLTPWNLVVRTLQYNPLIAAAKTGIEAIKGNTRAAEISAGRMVVGGLLYGAGYFLYQNGLIGPSLEGRNESQKARLLSGEVLPPNHVNISGLKRAKEGGDPAFQPGDETIDLTRGGGAAGAILSSVANIGRKMERKPESGGGELAASLVRDGVLEQANFTINQSFLKGVTGLLDAIQHGNFGPYVQGVESMLLNVGTPNTLTALSRATRENVPDMKTETVAQEFGNVVRNRFGILGADDYLPTKRDLFGGPMPQTPEGRNAILYHLFDISKGRQVTDDPVKLELYRLWRRTASNEAIPSIPDREITVDKKTYPLPTPLYSRYVELVGKERKLILDEMVQGKYYNESTDEEKIKLLEKAYREGAAEGKYLFLQEHESELVPKPERAGFKK